MQGNLSEIDICSILQLIELGQQTGLLYIEVNSIDRFPQRNINLHQKRLVSPIRDQFAGGLAPTANPTWFIFCDRGEIIYANDGDMTSARLNDYLRYYRLQLPSRSTDSISSGDCKLAAIPEYEDLWMLLRQDMIDTNRAYTILNACIQETIFDVLNISQGQFIFIPGWTLTPRLYGLEITPLIRKTSQKIRNWQALYPQIQSPQQLPQMGNPQRVNAGLPASTVQKLQRWADGKTSLRRLSRYLHRDILSVGKAIYPYVQQGFVELVYPQPQSALTTDASSPPGAFRLALLGTEMPRWLQSILVEQGYEAIAIPQPFDSLLRLFDIKPHLILIHTRICNEENYDLCGMLRHSQTFKFIPIIILCQEDGYINRVRAKICGATDLIEMPCQERELLVLIEEHLHKNAYNQCRKQPILVEGDKYKVKDVITESISGDKNFVSEKLVNE